MRVPVAVDVTEGRGDSWCGRLAQIEDERLARSESVGEELPVGGHLVLGVMGAIGQTRNRKRGDQTAIPRAVLGHVENRQEVRLRRVG